MLTDPSWEPSLAAPIINSSLSMDDLLSTYDTGNFLQEDSNHFLTLIYESYITSDPASSIFIIPPQSKLEQFNLDSTQVALLQFAPDTTLTETISNTMDFTFSGGAEIENITFKAGSLSCNINSDFQHDIQIILTVPDLKLNGIVLQDTIMIDYSGGLPAVTNNIYDISDYNLNLTLGGTTNNTLQYDIEVSLFYDNGNPVSTLDILSIDITLDNLSFYYVDGYLGSLPFTVNTDSLDLDIFNNSILGNLLLEDPKIRMNMYNSFGVPVDVTFTQLDAVSGGSTIPFTATNLPGPISLSYPNMSQVGQSVTTTLLFDKTNSNVISVINNIPQKILYAFDASSNPGGNTGTGNFITDSSRFDLDFEVELPLYGGITGIIFQDTFDIDIGTIDEVKSVEFKINSENGFPMDAFVQIYFTDEAYNKIDSLMTAGQNNIIESGLVDANGEVIQAKKKTTTVPIETNRLQVITSQSKKAIIQATLNTTNNGGTPVKIYSNSNLNIKLGILTKLKVS